MKNIITPAEAVALAFGAGEYMPPEAVSEADIAAAAHRYIEPVTGAALASALAAGEYPALRDDYAAPALALGVRLLVQPSLDIRTGCAGSVVQRTTTAEPAPAEARAAALRSVRCRMRELLRRLGRHLDERAADYPEYDPDANILNRCTTDGGFVQIF
ncbi:MAG: hypothetical protein K2J33_06030 [Alistipes sp.]|nr:hypothetical protein [Alistipes sp.]